MEKSYELRYGWSCTSSDYVFTEYKVFLTKEERDKHLFDIVHSKFFIIKWYKKIDIEDWKSWDC